MRKSNRAIVWVTLAITLLACGAEAPPRQGSVNNTPLSGTVAPAAVTSIATLTATVRVTPAEQPDPRSLGNPRAPIVLVEFGDYQ